MTATGTTRDLIVLVADKNTEFALKGLLSRRARSLRIRPLTADIFVHPERDPGCLLRARDFLRPHVARYHHALVLFDRDGCGQEQKDRAALERQVEEQLAQAGWGERAAAVVLDPELEIWVWSDSPHVEKALGWQGRSPGLRSWLVNSKLLDADRPKPVDPKRAVEEALRLARKPRSSNLYLELASSVGFEGCTDAAFQKLRDTLGRWFSVPQG
jgi:nucleotide-binding universal stress UspA family protein